mgnify:CR=1 FL=1
MARLLEIGDLYPLDPSKKRSYHENFWWDIVRPTKEKVGSSRAKAKEVVAEDDHVQGLFEFLASDVTNEDYSEFDVDEREDDDDGDQSVVSSTMGGYQDPDYDVSFADEAECEELTADNLETMNENERNATISGNLKKLGNVKKQHMSPLIMKDLLGDDGSAAVVHLKESHLKSKKRHKPVINEVY